MYTYEKQHTRTLHFYGEGMNASTQNKPCLYLHHIQNSNATNEHDLNFVLAKKLQQLHLLSKEINTVHAEIIIHLISSNCILKFWNV